jgi:hypothetical protein
LALKITLSSLVFVLALSVAARAECPAGDLNNDCRVDSADLLMLAEQWLTGPEGSADLDHSGQVDGADLALLGSDWRRQDCPIVITEVLAHAHAAASDWVELHNPSSAPVYIGGWFLSDNRNDLTRYQIPAGTTIEPNGYIVFYETTHFASPFDPGVRTPFAFSENGEVVCLFSGDDALFPDFLLSEPFGASDTGYSFGRHVTSTGTYDFATMSEVTPGEANAYPLVGPVVINEIMYHPPVVSDAEYIELLNVSGGPVTLFDFATMEPWRLTDGAGIEFRFPSDVPVRLEADEHVLLVRDVDAMRQYALPTEVKMFDWGAGRLANQGETVLLLRPGDVDERGTRYWIEVSRVEYSDGSHGEEFPGGVDPWPAQADGLGPSLNCIFPSRYGNDPNNWHATIPTPGSVND